VHPPPELENLRPASSEVPSGAAGPATTGGMALVISRDFWLGGEKFSLAGGRLRFWFEYLLRSGLDLEVIF